MELPNGYKVYGVSGDGQHRQIVSAKSMKQASELTKINYRHFRSHGSITGNDLEVDLCTKNLEVVFITPINAKDYKIKE